MGVLLKICCIFSQHLFLRTPLDGCFGFLYSDDVLTVVFDYSIFIFEPNREKGNF